MRRGVWDVYDYAALCGFALLFLLISALTYKKRS